MWSILLILQFFLHYCKETLQIVRVIMLSFLGFALKPRKSMFDRYLGNWLNTFSNSWYNLSFKTSLLSSVGAVTFRKTISHKQFISTIYNTLLQENTTLLIACIISLFTQLPSAIHDFNFPLRTKTYIN
jgi:hypothetical protein